MAYVGPYCVVGFYNIIPDTSGLGRTLLSVEDTFVERFDLDYEESKSCVTTGGTNGRYFRLLEVGDTSIGLNLLHITTGTDPVATTSSPMIQPGTYYSDFIWLPPGHKIAILPVEDPYIPVLLPPEE